MNTTTEPVTTIEISALLPPDARDMLTRAAREAAQMTQLSVERETHIEEAVQRVRNLYPHYFRIEAIQP